MNVEKGTDLWNGDGEIHRFGGAGGLGSSPRGWKNKDKGMEQKI